MSNYDPPQRNHFSRGLWVLSLAVVIFLPAFFSGCSSAPRRPEEVFTVRITATNLLNLASYNASQGRFEEALFILEDAWRLVLSTDDPPLRVTTAISRGSILFSLGRYAEAFETWESASAEGDASLLPVPAAQARIYTIRARLVQLSNTHEGGQEADAEAEQLRAQVLREIAAVRAEAGIVASGYLTLALAQKQLRRWTEAENAAREALRIYERDRLLEDTAYAWFIIASIRSVSGNHNAALEALRTAIAFDRRAENGFGLASSWHAMGDVYQNAGRIAESRAAHRRAADIYRAIGLYDRAEALELLLR